MAAQSRRLKLLKKLKEEASAITGSELSEVFNVSRQVIVQDIALLRAQGEEIAATSKGYIISQPDNNMVEKVVACCHDEENLGEELEIVIKYGGRVKDVIVEHPIYGEIKGMLMIQNRDDLEDFIVKHRQADAKLLSALTEGVHLHTIEALNQEVLKLIEERLDDKGLLLKS